MACNTERKRKNNVKMSKYIYMEKDIYTPGIANLRRKAHKTKRERYRSLLTHQENKTSVVQKPEVG